MKWGRSAGPRGYHHGNLKEALVRAALELIAEKGPAGFTFADAARWAGVSPRRCIGIFAIETRCSPMLPAAAFRSLQARSPKPGTKASRR
jgi:hypothetical protein